MSPNEFIKELAPGAVASMKECGICASFTIAQAALESSWGRSKLSIDGCNLFGVKADKSWPGPTLDMQTGEHLNGKDVIVPATWRKYPNWAACIEDHAKFFFENPRYKLALHLKADPVAFAKAIQTAKYCTDPHYSDKISSIIETHNLRRFDS